MKADQKFPRDETAGRGRKRNLERERENMSKFIILCTLNMFSMFESPITQLSWKLKI